MVKDMKKTIKNIDDYIKIAPKFPEKEVYRGLKLKPTIKEIITTPGHIIKDKAFSSYTSDIGVTGKFDSNVILKVINKDGVSISHMAQFPEELEVLMPSNKAFKVISSTTQSVGGRDITMVNLEEVIL